MKTLSVFTALAIASWSIVASVRGADSCEGSHISSRGMPTMHSTAFDHIQTKLDEQTEMEFIDTPLHDVLEFLKVKHELEIQIDRKALEEAAIATDTPITRRIKGISLRSALKLMLRDSDLCYIVRDEVLLITSREYAATMLDVRVYQVCDLVDAESEEEAKADYEKLTDVIQAIVSPQFWSETGGPGMIRSLPTARVLAIAATDEVHEQIEGLLSTLRMARDAQKSQ
jgi:hypothetical protein